MIETPYKGLQECEESVIQETYRVYKGEIEFFKRYYNELVNLLNFIIPLTPLMDEGAKEPTKEFMILATTSKMCLRSAAIYSLTIKGHYQDALILHRSLLEDFETLLFFYHYPNKIKQWANGKIPMSKVVNLINKSIRTEGPDFYTLILPIYRGLSIKVHPTIDSLREIINIKEHGVQMFPDFKEDNSGDTIMMLVCYQWILLHTLYQIFKEHIIEQGLENPIRNSLDALGNFIETRWDLEKIRFYNSHT